MRRFRFSTVVVILAVSLLGAVCDGSPDDAPPPPSPSARVAAPALPAGVPASFDEDIAGRDLPFDELVPPGTEVTGRLLASIPGGDAAVVMYAEPSRDPLATAHGFVVWRREAGTDPPWRAVLGMRRPPRDGVMSVQGITGDATGDGSDDALLFEATGGVGACGTWRVIDLASGAQRWHRNTCDTRIDIGMDPPGLVLTETVYEPGDAHCCPSAVRTRILEHRPPDGFVETSRRTEPLA